jgi:Fe-Mn family superoxide dismutase
MYTPKDYKHLIGIEGLSNKLLSNHFSLYEGYVKNTNKLFELIDNLHDSGETNSPVFAELKRRLGWEWNGMRLHEYYFENLTKNFKNINENSALYKKIIAGYDNFNYWLEDFRAAASMRGIGWVVLYYDKEDDCLINSWINEHDAGHPAGCTPVLIMDVFEHAFTLDYGIKKADYINAFFKIIDWPAAEKRFENTQK